MRSQHKRKQGSRAAAAARAGPHRPLGVPPPPSSSADQAAMATRPGGTPAAGLPRRSTSQQTTGPAGGCLALGSLAKRRPTPADRWPRPTEPAERAGERAAPAQAPRQWRSGLEARPSSRGQGAPICILRQGGLPRLPSSQQLPAPAQAGAERRRLAPKRAGSGPCWEPRPGPGHQVTSLAARCSRLSAPPRRREPEDAPCQTRAARSRRFVVAPHAAGVQESASLRPGGGPTLGLAARL